MMIYTMSYGHPLWDETADFAENCSWRAGKVLAHQMRDNRFSDNERVFAATEDGRIIGFCTFSEKDSLPDDAPYTPFIGFMFVDELARGRRISQKMIGEAEAFAKHMGFDAIYIISEEQGLYEKYGFVKTDDCKTVYGTVEQLLMKKL
ncbi:MAG: GNAT family N-acetyltransferase [Oscillospiraceae bacterium]|nr:GNAT family N-acetyltransferase [Oscillospiraceae bacterium]